MASVALGDVFYRSYAEVDAARAYLQSAATDEQLARALVTATRILDRQRWRTGYAAFELRIGVDDIVNAAIEVAGLLLQGSDLQIEQTTAQKLRTVRAGRVREDFFRGAGGPGHRFPTTVHELLATYLGTHPSEAEASVPQEHTSEFSWEFS